MYKRVSSEKPASPYHLITSLYPPKPDTPFLTLDGMDDAVVAGATIMFWNAENMPEVIGLTNKVWGSDALSSEILRAGDKLETI